jgi:hypothetical protein
MIKVKIDDRAALERAYPPDAYAADTVENLVVSNEAMSGVRILSAPDSAGEFSLGRGRRQIGEAASTVFLSPYRPAGDAATPEALTANLRAAYDAFLGEIIEAAQQFGFRPDEALGRGDPRIRGLRQ